MTLPRTNVPSKISSNVKKGIVKMTRQKPQREVIVIVVFIPDAEKQITPVTPYEGISLDKLKRIWSKKLHKP